MLEKTFEKYRDLIIKSEHFITNKSPVYSLKECLENINDEILNEIYFVYSIKENNRNLNGNMSKDDKIKFLQRNIKIGFNDMLYSIDGNRDIIEKIIENDTVKPDAEFLCCGYVFGFKEKNIIKYIVPKELIEIYNDFQKNHEKEVIVSNIKDILFAYIMSLGIVKKEIVVDLILNYYKIKTTRDEIDYVINNMGIKNYKGYLGLYELKDDENFDEIINFIDIKNNQDFVKLTTSEITDYNFFILDMIDKVNAILTPKNKKFCSNILTYILLSPLAPEEILEEYNLTKKERTKIDDLIVENEDYIRFWCLDGKTKNEATIDYFTNMALKEKPKGDLEDVIKSIPNEVYNVINENYSAKSKKELVKNILDNLNDELSYLDEFEIEDLLDYNGSILYRDTDSALLENGFIFSYKDKDEVKCFIPNDIVEILRKNAYQGNDVKNLVNGYLEINGIIEKEKLRELLNQYHNLDLSIKELDEICESIEINIIDKYYTCISNFTIDDIKSFIYIKNSFPKYKRIDEVQLDLYYEFYEKLEELMIDKLKLTSESFGVVITCVRNGSFNEDILNDILESLSIEIKSSEKREILELYKANKGVIPVWTYNGYTSLEKNNIKIKNEKVGRNDPCPCGSGKKYKKCCGK